MTGIRSYNLSDAIDQIGAALRPREEVLAWIIDCAHPIFYLWPVRGCILRLTMSRPLFTWFMTAKPSKKPSTQTKEVRATIDDLSS